MQKSSNLQEIAYSLRTSACQLDEYLKTIKALIKETEPQIHALVSESDRWVRLKADANKLSDKYSTTEERPPLYGVLVGVKDNFHVDGLLTKAGSELPPEELTGSEASVVQNIKNNGALILGKTVTTEFAFSNPGPTRNPRDSKYTPGGSSSGSAAAVAAGYCPLAIGSQTGGSVIRPAAFCGITGFKPSYGRIPQDGMIPFAPTVDHVGLFTKTPECMRFAANIICPDWKVGPLPKRNPIIGVPEEEYLSQASLEALTKFEKQLDLLKSSGYEIERIQVFNDVQEENFLHKQLLSAEKALSHYKWFINHRKEYSDATRKFLERGRNVDVGELADNRLRIEEFREQVIGKMREANIDLLVAPPAIGPAPKGISNTGSPVMNQLWTRSHLPVVNIPIDQSKNGLPIGLQIVSRHGNDEWLLDWASKIYNLFK